MKSSLIQTRTDAIKNNKLVAIIRVADPEQILPIVDYLAEAGVKVVEVTSNTPHYQDYLPKLKAAYPQLLIGAGTIINPHLAEQAIAAGAEFLVTPNVSEAVIHFAHQHQVPIMVGAFTPTEIVTAQEAGADFIKLFPAEPMGPEYFEALAGGPFLGLDMVPVGGIDEVNAGRYLKAGAKGIGIGGSLVCPVQSESHRAEVVARLQQLIEQL